MSYLLGCLLFICVAPPPPHPAQNQKARAMGTPAPGLDSIVRFTQGSRLGLSNSGPFGPAMQQRFGLWHVKESIGGASSRKNGPGLSGASLVPTSLSLKPNAGGGLQTEINRLMANKAGAVVLMDVASGKILAQRNINVAAQRPEFPGSTVKPFVLMELLSSGKVNPEQKLMCRRPLYIGGRRMDCSHPAGITSLDAPDAIAYSCNTYFSAIATRLDPAELAEMYKRMGFTSPTGLVASETAGRIRTATEQSQLQLQALGEWGVEVTPLELLAAYTSLARQKREGKDLGSAAPVFDGLERAVKYGMAHGAQPAGTTAAGKTGTASGMKTAQTHGLFVGYAPADKPEIVLLVYLERGRGIDAAAIAGPLITTWWKNK